jgi:hypothetical protein
LKLKPLPAAFTPPSAGICNAMLNNFPFINRLMLALLLAGVFTGQAHAEAGGEAAVKTAFLYNFFKFIDWPKAAGNQSAYSLCTTDNDNLGDSLLVLENKTINNKPLVIRRGVNGQDLKDCYMVFISSSENAAAIARELKGLQTVTISDKPNFIDQGGMIGLIPGDNRLSFEVNLAAANAGGVHISAQMLKLAKRVNAAN